MAEDEGGRIIVANDAFSRLFHLPPPDELIGTSADVTREMMWRGLTLDGDTESRRSAELRQRRVAVLGFELVLRDGRVFDRDYVPVPAPDGSMVHMWHYRDVTDRRQMEQRLRESSRRLRELSAFAEDAREEERRQLARTLHDELGQLFTSIRLELGVAIAQFRESRAPAMRRVVDRLQAAAGLTDIGVTSLRRLTTALRPPVLDHLGLVPAIRWEASLFSKRTGIRCHVRARPASIDGLDEARVTALYRILLGALENIARHAAAGTAWIDVTRRRGLTILKIRDNGRGITDEQIHNPRTMGLIGMHERALALGGEVRISGTRGKGTRVVVILPDANTAAAQAGREGARPPAHA